MSADSPEREPDRRSATLFDESQLPVPAAPCEQVDAANAGAARVMAARRDQIELRACDLDSLLGADHAGRTVWAFVQSLDLGALHAKIKAVEHAAGRPAIDPAILVALWLWATIDGVGSAREIDRLCERDDAYRWICGGVGVNYHTLADFRTRHVEWLDAQLTRSIASLLERKLVTPAVVSQDGLRVRAAAKAASFRRRSRLQEFVHEARAQVDALKSELEEDAGAGPFDPACRTIEDFVADCDNHGGCTALAVPAQDENDLHVDGKPSAIAAPGWRDQANEMGGMP